MAHSTKFLIGGIVLAALVFGGGQALTWRLEAKLYKAIASCEANTHEVCDPNILAKLNEDAEDPGELVNLQRQISTTSRWVPWITFAIAIFAALPWLWYFLLRRIRELTNSIAGR